MELHLQPSTPARALHATCLLCRHPDLIRLLLGLLANELDHLLNLALHLRTHRRRRCRWLVAHPPPPWCQWCRGPACACVLSMHSSRIAAECRSVSGALCWHEGLHACTTDLHFVHFRSKTGAPARARAGRAELGRGARVRVRAQPCMQVWGYGAWVLFQSAEAQRGKLKP